MIEISNAGCKISSLHFFEKGEILAWESKKTGILPFLLNTERKTVIKKGAFLQYS